MKTEGERRYTSTVFDLGNRWRWAVSFTPKLLYLHRWGKSPHYWLARWAQELVWMLWSREKSCPSWELNPSCPAHSLSLHWALPAPSLWHRVSYNGTYVFTHTKYSYQTAFQVHHSAIIVVSLSCSYSCHISITADRDLIYSKVVW
jgi:hypothetical protein